MNTRNPQRPNVYLFDLTVLARPHHARVSLSRVGSQGGQSASDSVRPSLLRSVSCSSNDAPSLQSSKGRQWAKPLSHVEIIDAERRGQPTVLRMSGEIDRAAAPGLDTAFYELADFPRTEVIVDASLVTFMDTAGGRALILGKARVQKAGARIVLITSPVVRRFLELAFPGPLFAARVETMEQAREALRSAE